MLQLLSTSLVYWLWLHSSKTIGKAPRNSSSSTRTLNNFILNLTVSQILATLNSWTYGKLSQWFCLFPLWSCKQWLIHYQEKPRPFMLMSNQLNNKVGAETEKQLQRNEDILKFLKALTNCGIPLCYGLFVVCFFMYGIWCQYGAHWVKFSFIKCTTLVNVNKLFRTHNTYNFSFCFYARGLFNMSCSTVGNCNFSTQIVLIYLVDVYINSFFTYILVSRFSWNL